MRPKLFWIAPLLWLLAACSEGALVLPLPLQTPLVLPSTSEATPNAETGATEETQATEEDEATEEDVVNDVFDTTAELATYLYTGPGRFYEEVGTVFPGKALRLTGQDAAGDWYRIDDGTWINALAIRGRPELPVISEITGRAVAQVTEVLDGDTIVVNFNDRAYEVRLLLSVAPQVEQAFGVEAYEWTRDRLTGQNVLLEADVVESDAYGRLLRYVYLAGDESMINEEILREGLAQVAVFPPANRYVAQLRLAQSEAEIARRGLWSAEAVPYREDRSGCSYTVQPGETLQVIARRFGLLTETLAAANNVTDPNLVPDGAVLVIPGCGEGSEG